MTDNDYQSDYRCTLNISNTVYLEWKEQLPIFTIIIHYYRKTTKFGSKKILRKMTITCTRTTITSTCTTITCTCTTITCTVPHFIKFTYYDGSYTLIR